MWRTQDRSSVDATMTRDGCISAIVRSVSLVLALCLASFSSAQSSEIHEAAADGDIERVRVLLAKDPTLANAKDRIGSTPLHWAAAEGHEDVVRLLLSNRADVNARPGNLVTPLGSAAHRGQADIVKLLISNGANVDLADVTHITPPATAAFGGYKQIVEILLANNAQVNVKDEHGSTPLHEAAAAGSNEIVSLLLANKADVNARDIEGRTPLSYAQTENHEEIVELLLEHGARALSNDSAPCVFEDIKCSVAYIVSAEQRLAEVRASTLAAFKSVEQDLAFAKEQSDKWEDHAQLEQESRMKSVTYVFRDAFRSHAKRIDKIVEDLRELGSIGEKLELDLKFLRILQADLERIQQGKLASQTMPIIASTKEGIDTVQEGVSVSRQALKIAQDSLSAERSADLKFNKEFRQMLAFTGDPQDSIKKWEKQVIQTELENSDKEDEELAQASALGIRIAGTLTVEAGAMRLTRVEQRTGEDCTIAVMATVMGPPFTYEEVLDARRRYPMFTREGLVSAWWETYLKDCGFGCEYKPTQVLVATVRGNDEVGILMLAPIRRYQNGHMVAVDEMGFINPSTGWPDRIATLEELLAECARLGGCYIPEPEILAVTRPDLS